MSLFKPSLSFARSTLFVCAVAVSGTPLLQGCFPPLVVAGIAAGVGAGALVVTDRRTTGALFDDEAIEVKTSDLIGKHFGRVNHVNITSYNRNVLLTGEVQDERAWAEMQRLAATVPNVRHVINELVVAPPSAMSSRSNDSLITSNVKTRFMGHPKSFSATHVKVVTEAGTVFLMGIVTPEEGDKAAEIASTSKGVKRVVKAFEYMTSKGDSSPASSSANTGASTDDGADTQAPAPVQTAPIPPEAP